MALIYTGIDGNFLADNMALPGYIKSLLHQGKIEVSAKSDSLHLYDIVSHKTRVLPIKSSAFMDLKNGKLDGPTVHGLSVMLNDGLVSLVSGKEGKEEDMGVALDKLLSGSTATEAGPVGASQGNQLFPMFDKEKLTTGETVPLRVSNKMYQPVKGTDSNSRYFMVAAADGLRVAARYRSSSQRLSIRVEGEKLHSYCSALALCGFEGQATESGHMSMHLTVGDDMIAAKALGAVLLGLGLNMMTPLPKLDVIKDKGA